MTDLALTAEQQDLQRTLRRALAEQLGHARLRSVIAGEDDAWALTAQQLGVHGLAVPEAAGGSGASELEQALLLEEAGRALVPGGFFSTVALVGSLLRAAEDQALLPAVAEGALRVAFAWCTSDRVLAPAVRGTDLVSGTATAVLDAAEASVLLAVSSDGALLAVDKDQPGVALEPLQTLDLTRPAATVRFDQARARVLGPVAGLPLMRVALAAEQVGGAARCLDLSVDYALVREQFGRPIGSFQAVKHKLADMRVRVDLARALCRYAAAHPDEPQWALAAGSTCSETYLRVATDAIQVHGGIGFTWEHELHLHYRRARADHAMLGTPRAQRAELAALLVEEVA